MTRSKFLSMSAFKYVCVTVETEYNVLVVLFRLLRWGIMTKLYIKI